MSRASMFAPARCSASSPIRCEFHAAAWSAVCPCLFRQPSGSTLPDASSAAISSGASKLLSTLPRTTSKIWAMAGCSFHARVSRGDMTPAMPFDVFRASLRIAFPWGIARECKEAGIDSGGNMPDRRRSTEATAVCTGWGNPEGGSKYSTGRGKRGEATSMQPAGATWREAASINQQATGPILIGRPESALPDIPTPALNVGMVVLPIDRIEKMMGSPRARDLRRRL